MLKVYSLIKGFWSLWEALGFVTVQSASTLWIRAKAFRGFGAVCWGLGGGGGEAFGVQGFRV